MYELGISVFIVTKDTNTFDNILFFGWVMCVGVSLGGLVGMVWVWTLQVFGYDTGRGV